LCGFLGHCSESFWLNVDGGYNHIHTAEILSFGVYFKRCVVAVVQQILELYAAAAGYVKR
jgi:hypothetical protein